jgi:hypothetical protein
MGVGSGCGSTATAGIRKTWAGWGIAAVTRPRTRPGRPPPPSTTSAGRLPHRLTRALRRQIAEDQTIVLVSRFPGQR